MYLLTVIDRSTGWVEADPMKSMEATMCVDAFITNWQPVHVITVD
jgi:hypothetical protein